MSELKLRAYRYWDDGKQWIRLISETDEWDEPITGWIEVHDLIRGFMVYRNEKTGQEARG